VRLECKGGPQDGRIVEDAFGLEQRFHSPTKDGVFKEHVYKLAFEGDGAKWNAFLTYWRTETFDAETSERVK
jgi:hypothetical protein